MKDTKKNLSKVRRRIIWFTTIGFIVVGTVSAAVSIFPFINEERVAHEALLLNSVSKRKADIDIFFSEMRERIRLTQANNQLQILTRDYLYGQMRSQQMVERGENILRSVVSLDEQVLGHMRILKLKNVQFGVGEGVPLPFWKDFSPDLNTSSMSGPYSYAVRERTVYVEPLLIGDELIGHDLIVLNSSTILDLISDRDDLGETGRVYIGHFTNKKAHVGFSATSTYKSLIPAGTQVPANALSAIKRAVSESPESHIKLGGLKDPIITISAPLHLQGWALVISMHKNELYGKLSSQILYALVSVAILLLLGVVVLHLLLKPLTRILKHKTEELEEQLSEKTEKLTEELLRRKLAEEESMLAREAAEIHNKLMSDVLNKVNVDIRTPLNGIVTMTELLEQSDLSPQHMKYVKTLKESSERLVPIVSELLSVKHFDPDLIQFKPKSFSLRDRMQEHIAPFELRTQAAGLSFMYIIDEELPDHLIGDPHRLGQILSAFVDFSMKSCSEGDQITINVTSEDITPRDVELTISVQNNGRGMYPEVLNKLNFYFKGESEDIFNGNDVLSIGLKMATRLVDIMAGKIWATSKTGEGSTLNFTVRLPRGKKGIKQYPRSEKIIRH